MLDFFAVFSSIPLAIAAANACEPSYSWSKGRLHLPWQGSGVMDLVERGARVEPWQAEVRIIATRGKKPPFRRHLVRPINPASQPVEVPEIPNMGDDSIFSGC